MNYMWTRGMIFMAVLLYSGSGDWDLEKMRKVIKTLISLEFP